MIKENKMNCPYCNKEMEKGVIQSPYEIAWNPKRYLIGLLEDFEGAVTLSKHSMIKGSAVVSYLCRDCEKVIIDYEKDHDLNEKKESLWNKINDKIT